MRDLEGANLVMLIFSPKKVKLNFSGFVLKIYNFADLAIAVQWEFDK